MFSAVPHLQNAVVVNQHSAKFLLVRRRMKLLIQVGTTKTIKELYHCFVFYFFYYCDFVFSFVGRDTSQNDDEMEPLTLVWAKCRGYPSYPAMVRIT